MALRDLKSSLKNLRFDKDTPGGGSSGLPYIKGGVPESTPGGKELADLARFSSDGNIRGGLFSIVSSETDRVRISRFLNDFPKGTLFTSKQIGLQRSNPLIETGVRGEKTTPNFEEAPNINTQVFSNSNLLAQIVLQGSGEHVPRPGFNVNDLLNSENKYEKIVSKKTTDENRLVTLYNNKILPPTGKILPDNLSKLGISTLPTELFKYAGGPGSSYGDGYTLIERAVNTADSYDKYILKEFTKTDYKPAFRVTSEEKPYELSSIAKKWNTPNGLLKIEPLNENFIEEATFYEQESSDFIRPEGVPAGYTFGNTMGYSELLLSEPGQLQDFRQQTNASTLANAVNYTKGGPTDKGFNMEARIGIGNPGGRDKIEGSRDNFYIEYKEGQDKVNMSPIYRKSIKTPVEQDSKDTRDLIKFVIESIDNGYPDETNRMHFRAFITNFSDNIGAEWNSQRYMGRGENFYTYQGFTREVGFTFKVAAQSVQEMEKLYQKLNYLASTLHPNYSPGGFMSGTIHQLTIGEYFYRMPGIIKTMNITVDDNYPWEIKMKQPELFIQDTISSAVGQTPKNSDVANNDRGQMEVPQILNIQMSFNPIYNKLPQKGLKEPIIVSDKIANNYLARNNFKFQL